MIGFMTKCLLTIGYTGADNKIAAFGIVYWLQTD